MKHSYKEMSDMFDRHERAYRVLMSIFGADEKGRLEFELFIKTQATLLAREDGK